MPERIADALDYDIAAQAIGRGERLVEAKIAERFDASRGSVRDALRLLAQRGSIELTPGRGAVVCGYSLDRLADSFAVGAMLIALGARYVAHHRSIPALARIGERVERIEALVAAGFSEPLEFATAVGGFTAAIVVGSGNSYVRSQFSAVLNRSVWRAMWEHPCDHLSHERQAEEAAQIRRTLALMEAGDRDGAERDARAFHQRHCDIILAELARRHGARAPASPPIAIAGVRAVDGGGLEGRLARIEAQMTALTERVATRA